MNFQQPQRIILLDRDEEFCREFVRLCSESTHTCYLPETYHFLCDLKHAFLQSPYPSILYLNPSSAKESILLWAHQIRQSHPYTDFVFISETSEYAMEAFDLFALHYICKPLTPAKLEETFLRHQKRTSPPLPVLPVHMNRKIIFINQSQISMIQSSNHKIIFTMKNAHSFDCYMSMSRLSPLLSYDFIKLRRGLIVHFDFIQLMAPDYCILNDGTEIDLSRLNRKQIHQAYQYNLQIRNIINI